MVQLKYFEMSRGQNHTNLKVFTRSDYKIPDFINLIFQQMSQIYLQKRFFKTTALSTIQDVQGSDLAPIREL